MHIIVNTTALNILKVCLISVIFMPEIALQLTNNDDAIL